ncbi:hypothetical protein GW797_07445 [Candidatus Parcubacteria bacterium]|nr:hypothetical protein [Candidatus Parcubacteria bacterium]
MPNPGDVFVYKQYVFEDGSQRDKWFIVLNTSDSEKPCIVLKTTSNGNHYQGCVKGCNKNRRCFFAPNSWQTCFSIDTYIQLPQIFHFSTATLLKDGFAGRIEFKQPLTSDCFSQLKSCLAGFKDDISQLHWDLIYKNKNA